MKIDNLEGKEVLYGFAAFWVMILVTATAVYFATSYGSGPQIHVSPAPVVNNVPAAAAPNVIVTAPIKIERIETEKAAPPSDVKIYAVMPAVKGETVIREIPVPVVGALREPVKVEVINHPPVQDRDPVEGKLLPPPKDARRP
jgi:hypothetical protein